MRKTYIIQNSTEGYGYHYASLSDMARQDISIPLMKTQVVDGQEYIYYFDEELNEWLQGARVVVPISKGMNEAQMYASAITYARKVTTQMARCVACRDDEDIENTDSSGNQKPSKATERQVDYIRKLYSSNSIGTILEKYKLEKLDDMPFDLARKLIESANEKQKNKSVGNQ